MSAQTPVEQALQKYSNWKTASSAINNAVSDAIIDLAEASSFLQYEVISEKQHEEEQQALANGSGNDAEAILEKIYPSTKNHPDAEAQTQHTGVPHIRRPHCGRACGDASPITSHEVTDHSLQFHEASDYSIQ